jgi:predicted porin
MGLSYNYTLSENKYVEGSDYAYRNHTVNLSIERGIAAGVVVNAGGSLSLINYLNPDSVADYTRFRKNHSQTLYAGVSYQFHPAIRLFTNLSWTSSSTNLPVGVVLNAQDVVEGQQSPVLGDYQRLMFTAGVAMNL